MIEPVSLLKNPCHTTKNLFPKKLKNSFLNSFQSTIKKCQMKKNAANVLTNQNTLNPFTLIISQCMDTPALNVILQCSSKEILPIILIWFIINNISPVQFALTLPPPCPHYSTILKTNITLSIFNVHFVIFKHVGEPIFTNIWKKNIFKILLFFSDHEFYRVAKYVGSCHSCFL